MSRPREGLDRRVSHLLDELILLSSMVEDAVLGAIEALRRHDLNAAQRVYDGDKAINARRFSLENAIIATIATQQPIMAGDLRRLASLFEVTIELERMGDYAKGIAKICLIYETDGVSAPPPTHTMTELAEMSAIATSMLRRATKAFVDSNIEEARSIPQEDDRVDHLYNLVYRELVACIHNNQISLDQANYLMWASHNLERLADRVTNICERTIYNVSGQLGEIDPSDDEMIVKD